VARVGIEPTDNHQGLSLAALPVCVPCRRASRTGFEPVISTVTGWAPGHFLGENHGFVGTDVPISYKTCYSSPPTRHRRIRQWPVNFACPGPPRPVVGKNSTGANGTSYRVGNSTPRRPRRGVTRPRTRGGPPRKPP